MSTSNASFRLRSYQFSKITLDFSKSIEEIEIRIIPKGIYQEKEKIYHLEVKCLLLSETIESNEKETCVDVTCNAEFEFKEELTLQEIPDYFYPNSIAIIFPYVRAMISTLSLQANCGDTIILPTMNLTNLQEELKSNTTVN